VPASACPPRVSPPFTRPIAPAAQQAASDGSVARTGLQGVRSYTQLCVVGVVKSLCASLAETGADGLLVELNVGDPLKAAQLQVRV
jgi:hypothetical protein